MISVKQYLTPELGSGLLQTAGIIVAALVVKKLSSVAVKAVVNKFQDDDPEHDTALEKRSKTLGGIVQNAFDVLIYGVAFVTLLSEWGVDIRPILTGAGVIGLAVGFGAQTLVKDVVTGFFILSENQFNIGDHVKIAGLEGRVIDQQLRTTVLRDENGDKHIIPNANISTVSRVRKK